MASDLPTDPLLARLDAFVGFARARTGDPELAADLVQECLLKAVQSDRVPADAEGAVTWFYRVLRHAIIDAHRRRTTRAQALAKLAGELPEAPAPETANAVCQCVLQLLPALPAADADLLRRVDLEGAPVSDLARAAGRRINTFNVRLLRARRRLRAELERVCRSCATHGCLDCDCR